MSENPWKKASDGGKTGGPPGGTAPPWMKPKTQQTQPSGPVQQNTPAPFKPPVQTSPVPANTNTQPATNAPPWMKANQAPGTQPPANKPPGFAPSNPVPATSGNVPAWMKNKQATSPIGTDRKQEQQKQKQQEELKLKQQQQEQQKKRKRQQQLKNQQRQRKMMQIEQQKSKLRQADDKLKQSPKKSKLSKKSSPSKSNLKSSSKSRKNLSKLISLFHKYIITLNLACSKQQQYRQKIDYQKQFIQNLYKFTQNAKQGIVKYLQQRKITQRKRNVINLQDLLIQYAVVEALSGQTGNIFFKIKSIELLEQKFSYYQVIFNIIVKLIKKLPIFRLRVPLMCRISYKGIQFLCESVCDQILDSVPSACQNFIQIQGQIAQLQKQLNQAGYPFLNKKAFSAKKINVDGTDFYILYLVQNITNFTQGPITTISTPLTFYPNCPLNFQSLTNLNLIASHSINLTYILMRQFQSIKTNATDKFKTSYLNLFQLAHAIRIVYASCQGQLEEETFWGLVFQQNNQIWTMIRRAYENIYGEVKEKQECCLKNKFILSKIIQTMVPVSFGVGKLKNTQTSYFTRRDKQQYTKVPAKIDNQAIVISYPLNTLQAFEIIQLFDKYLQNSLKLKTAEESNLLQEDFVKLSEQLYTRKIYMHINKAKLLFNKGNYKEAIELLENYQFKKGKQMEKIIVYPLLITFYMVAGQHKNSQTVEQQKTKQKQQNKQKMEQRSQKPKQNTEEIIKKQQQQQDKQKQKAKEVSDAQKSKDQPEKQKQKQKPQQDYEIKMLKIFNTLLTYLSQLFQDQQQIWAHADLYTILAAYYSKIKQNEQQQKQEPQNLPLSLSYKKQQSKPRMFSNSHAFGQKTTNIQKQKANIKISQSRAQSQPNYDQQLTENNNAKNKIKHPYHKQCLKFLQLTHRICLQFYGSHSFNMAQYLLHESQIYLNIYQYIKSQNSIQQALKIYKASSKHTKYIYSCSLILGKSIVERGKLDKDNKLIQQGIDILQKLTLDLSTLDMDNQIIQIFDYLSKSLLNINNNNNMDKNGKNSPSKKSQLQIYQQKNKAYRIQMYLQKIAQISINSKNIISLKQVIRQFVKNQLNFYSKDRTITLKDLYDDYVKQQIPQNQQQGDKVSRLEELILDLKEQKQIFGGFLEMIRWSLGIIKSKNDSLQWDRAAEVLKKIFGLFQEKEILTVLSF